MAKSSEYPSFTVTGWEIVPYISQSMELVPMEEVNENNTPNEGVAEALPLSFALPAEVQSREVFQLPTPTQSKLRSSKIDNRVNKSFSPLEIFDANELNEVEASIGHQALLKFLEGWEMETRKRPNGMRDKFYFHGMSKKMLRSLAEVKRFIMQNISRQDAPPQMGAVENGRASIDDAKPSGRGSTKRKREPKGPKTSHDKMAEAYNNQLINYSFESDDEIQVIKQLSPKTRGKKLKEVQNFLNEAYMNLQWEYKGKSKEEDQMPTQSKNLETAGNHLMAEDELPDFEEPMPPSFDNLEAQDHDLIDSMVNELHNPDFVLHIED